MMKLAIIGGTGLDQLDSLEILKSKRIETIWGAPSSPLTFGRWKGIELVFLARHGVEHNIAPHKINYRANIQALKDTGVDRIISVAAVGGIRADMKPGQLVIPDQIVDYSHSRVTTFYEGDEVLHIDFTEPYTASLREALLESAREGKLSVIDGGTYACTQGPRLETAAEIRKLKNDGCDLVGMTGMPEAALAREAGLDYAACAVVANWGAGLVEGEITMVEIERNLELGMTSLKELLSVLSARLE
ncbi:MAG: S-methyl-5'-thioadenosine phosphorylase [Gammaproteobacteria bacterium]|nr:MAG: S-methyl-5'-thioadenosine phosphorylase [Gammaproteobacteria bacterium]